MKPIGIIGGIGPESTVDYYRAMIAAYRERQPDGSYPAIIINSVDNSVMLGALMRGDFDAVTAMMVTELERLARAGAAVALLAANSPHVVFDEVQRRSPLPLVSIVEATRDEAARLGLTRLALFGTRYTMQGHFYQDVFTPADLALVVPADTEQGYIHDKYMNELVKGILLPDTRGQLLAIVAAMKARDAVDGVILGGTELPLILRDTHASGVPLLDTTVIHARAIVARAMQ